MASILGTTFGDMVIVKDLGSNSAHQRIVRVRCLKCGREKDSKLYTLKQGKGVTHASCGRGLKLIDKRFHTHWCNMRTRTTNENYEHYKNYGGRGIKSTAFKNFIDFYDTAYSSYTRHLKEHGATNTTLERIDVNGHYEPGNIKWATWEEQHSNTTKARKFRAISPDMSEYTSLNQSAFAREHGLVAKQIQACLAGRYKTHLGWKFEYIE